MKEAKSFGKYLHGEQLVLGLTFPPRLALPFNLARLPRPTADTLTTWICDSARDAQTLANIISKGSRQGAARLPLISMKVEIEARYPRARRDQPKELTPTSMPGRRVRRALPGRAETMAQGGQGGATAEDPAAAGASDDSAAEELRNDPAGTKSAAPTRRQHEQSSRTEQLSNEQLKALAQAERRRARQNASNRAKAARRREAEEKLRMASVKGATGDGNVPGTGKRLVQPTIKAMMRGRASEATVGSDAVGGTDRRVGEDEGGGGTRARRRSE
jgi:hypothetical protein